MRIDRLLIVSVLCFSSGLGLIFGYCNGTVGANAAYPLAGCSVHIDTTTNGPGALAGLVLTALGAVLLLCTTLIAVINQFRARAGKIPAP
jgi:hypothetical protein